MSVLLYLEDTMVKLCDLSESVRKAVVRDVSDILQYRYHVDKESINEFWDTMQIGIEARKKA
jgi:hypothetical protein